MIYEIYARTGDIELVKRSLPALLKEHEFWNSGIMPKCVPISLVRLSSKVGLCLNTHTS